MAVEEWDESREGRETVDKEWKDSREGRGTLAVECEDLMEGGETVVEDRDVKERGRGMLDLEN